MARRKAKVANGECSIRSYIDFSFEDRTYQIDPKMNKVYRRFVEIETAKAFTILSEWRARPATA